MAVGDFASNPRFAPLMPMLLVRSIWPRSRGPATIGGRPKARHRARRWSFVALRQPRTVAAIVEHELAAECVDENPKFSERIYEKMYNGSRSRSAFARGIAPADESRRRGVIMEAIAGVSRLSANAFSCLLQSFSLAH
jgi:hypothetical protein